VGGESLVRPHHPRPRRCRPGVREWLASLGRLEVAGAAFDTRLQGLPAFTGRASKSIRRHLARHGARIAASPESFLVEGLTGALAEANWGGPAPGHSA
jgi:hypothetical protein